jgi:serine/threonine-protein kinase
MTQRHQRVQELFRKALGLGPEEREAFLRRECGGDEGLRREVELLLEIQGETVDVSGAVEASGNDAAGDLRRGAPGETGGGFGSGEIFADRYRIVSLLGKGGMGEVYRAHDTVLDVPVAVKLLLASHTDSREQLIGEVRLAREVTHPAVCRVFDVGEADGRLYFTMEYVDGEDLSSLLGRIGRLPPDKVLDIAHQVCGGLAAAHAKGVIHRDLKPANIMIDGRGRVRITDFGIAVLGSAETRDAIAGTPAYMAPEQFDPDGVIGPSSDIHAVGLILHELLTGKAVYSGKKFTELFRQKMRTRPEPPSTFVSDIDPELERAVMRCISRSQADRPQSALELASELPGGDALALAVEAGATPKPGMVAAASMRRPIIGSAVWGLLAGLVALLATVVLLADPAARLENPSDYKAPSVLADRSDRMIELLGLDPTHGDRDWGFLNNPNAVGPVRSVLFWYRHRSPRALPSFIQRASDMVTLRHELELPQALDSESLLLMLDQAGRLVFLQSHAAFGDTPDRAVVRSADFDWRPLWTLAGLDGVELETVPGVLPVLSDAQGIWSADDPDRMDGELRVEAAAHQGRPVYLSVQNADEAAVGSRWEQYRRRAWLGKYIRTPLFLAIVLAALALGVHSVMRERSDLRGAGVVVAVVLLLEILASALVSGAGQHPLASDRLAVASELLAIITAAIAVGLCYIGLEPIVRRKRPETLIAWTKLLSGKPVNRAVGMSLLVGAVAGSAWAALSELDRLVLAWVGLELADGPLRAEQLNAVSGLGPLFGTAVNQFDEAIVAGLLTLSLIVFLGMLIRSSWATGALFLLVVGLVHGIEAGAQLPASVLSFGIPVAGMVLYLLIRFGLLSFVVAGSCFGLLTAFPLASFTGVWFAQAGYFAVALVLLIGLSGSMAAALGGPGKRRVSADADDRDIGE